MSRTSKIEEQNMKIGQAVFEDEKTMALNGVTFKKNHVAISVVHGRQDIANILLWTITIHRILREISVILCIIMVFWLGLLGISGDSSIHGVRLAEWSDG
jgi:hypothetical protein